MYNIFQLHKGDISDNGQVTIVDEDRLCYIVRSDNRGASGLRTISKRILEEFIEYTRKHPDATPRDARNELKDKSEIDRYEYGYESTIMQMAKMVLGQVPMTRATYHPGQIKESDIINSRFLHYLTALRTKPFMLLAGISGTGKSRIVREMAKACWKEGDEEYGKNHPRNFCMVQVKPNWHDSTELMGYVTRISGTPEYIPGPFLRFLAAAIKEPSVPYFLCLDEMNLAPVEQYFAEYLSVIESRKLNHDGTITTDPIIKPEDTQEYHDLIGKLLGDEERLKGTALTIPQNLFVVGTVNMDETTFSFSRKVLDRAMTIEMNEVDLSAGLKDNANEIGYIGNCIIGDAAEGCDVYEDNKELCDQVLAYLEKVNAALEGTPFKIAYRTRNEFLMYAVNRQKLAPESQLWQTLDEMTSMKILSRIEGDRDRTQAVLEELKALVDKQIVAAIPPADEGKPSVKSITATKIDEMVKKLQSTSFTSYWT